ncbi:MAG: hypothetical protein ACI977_000758 [Candidatus Nanohaloarchaea archaeon]|jgi:hypothetical protein
MEKNSLVLKGLTGSVILIGATLVALPGAAANADTRSYGVTPSSLDEHDYASSLLAQDAQNQIGIAAAPAQGITTTKRKEQELEVLDFQEEKKHEVQITESIDLEEYTVDFTDSGEDAAYLTVREEGEIVHDDAYSEDEQLEYEDLTVEVEKIDHRSEQLDLKTSVRNGYVLHGGPSVNELVEKLEKVNPRLDVSDLKDGTYNALIVTGENTEEAVKNLASLQEGVEKSKIDIETS